MFVLSTPLQLLSCMNSFYVHRLRFPDGNFSNISQMDFNSYSWKKNRFFPPEIKYESQQKCSVHVCVMSQCVQCTVHNEGNFFFGLVKSGYDFVAALVHNLAQPKYDLR